VDIGFDLKPPPARGRKALRLNVSKKRDLTQSDVESLWDIPEGGLESSTNQILKIRNTHHALARLIAEGRKQVEVSAITGYSPSYISTIQHDPAFKNLVAYYKSQVEETFTSVHERLAALSMLSAEELQERLATDPDSFTNRELNELLTIAADRTGFGPQSRNVNVNVNVDFASRLEAARRRAGIGEDTTPSSAEGPQSPDKAPPVLELRPNAPERLAAELSIKNLYDKD
jgi:hypothetical protein